MSVAAPQTLELTNIDAPLALCTAEGNVQVATSQTLVLLQRLGVEMSVPSPLPLGLWRQLQLVPVGEAVQWRPPELDHILGCTRYRVDTGYLLVMKELTKQHVALSRRLHRQRLEATGRLAASIAHELRNAVTAIAYCADFLYVAGPDIQVETIQETASEMLEASERLQFTVAGLLDFARLGPTVAGPVSLTKILNRAERFVRVIHGGTTHRISKAIHSTSEWVVGNTLVIEQIFVNLLLNAIEIANGPAQIELSATRVDPPWNHGDGAKVIRVTVQDSGPGVPCNLKETIFEPFFTTHPEGLGLGLPTAREAAESLGGALTLETKPQSGACFSVYLPRGDKPV